MSNMKVIESIKQNQIYIIFWLVQMEFDVIDICTYTIIVFLISVYLLKYVLPLLDKYPRTPNQI